MSTEEKNPITGTFSNIQEESVPFSISFTADENGFKPVASTESLTPETKKTIDTQASQVSSINEFSSPEDIMKALDESNKNDSIPNV